jgi:hypothetical protein
LHPKISGDGNGTIKKKRAKWMGVEREFFFFHSKEKIVTGFVFNVSERKFKKNEKKMMKNMRNKKKNIR